MTGLPVFKQLVVKVKLLAKHMYANLLKNFELDLKYCFVAITMKLENFTVMINNFFHLLLFTSGVSSVQINN